MIEDNATLRIELAKEGMHISLICLAVRLHLKKLSVEELYQLQERIHRYRTLTEVLNL